MATGGDQVQRGGGAGEAGQALRAAAAREQAQVDLRQADLRRGRGDPVVGAERDFEAAAQRGAVDGCDDGLGGIIQDGEDRGSRVLRGVAAELGDVRAGDEGAAGADEHDGLR